MSLFRVGHLPRPNCALLAGPLLASLQKKYNNAQIKKKKNNPVLRVLYLVQQAQVSGLALQCCSWVLPSLVASEARKNKCLHKKNCVILCEEKKNSARFEGRRKREYRCNSMAKAIKGIFSDKNKTFVPKKQFAKGTKRYELHKHAKATLGSGNLRLAVALPESEDLNEWLAVNTVDFFNQINLLYGSITEFCTPKQCPVMSAGPKYEYLWADGKTIKKPIKVSAPEYVDFLMTWVQVGQRLLLLTYPSSFPLYFNNYASLGYTRR